MVAVDRAAVHRGFFFKDRIDGLAQRRVKDRVVSLLRVRWELEPIAVHSHRVGRGRKCVAQRGLPRRLAAQAIHGVRPHLGLAQVIEALPLATHAGLTDAHGGLLIVRGLLDIHVDLVGHGARIRRGAVLGQLLRIRRIIVQCPRTVFQVQRQPRGVIQKRRRHNTGGDKRDAEA